jgi:hypothetical protein
MILKLSIFGLVLVLIAVIAISHYVNKERFENAQQPATIADLEVLLQAMKDALPILQALPSDAATTQRIKDIHVMIEIIPDLITSVKGGANPPTAISRMYKNAIDYTMTILTDPSIPLPDLDKPHSPVDHKMAHPSAPSMPELTGACANIADSTPIKQVPLACMQQMVVDSGCKENTGSYPMDMNNELYNIPKVTNFGILKEVLKRMKNDMENLLKDPTFRKDCLEPINKGNQSAPAPQFNEIKPQISVSDTGYAAMQGKQKSDLLQSIQKIVRNELLANRMTQPTLPHKKGDDDNAEDDSHCTAQGNEFKKITPKRMSKGCPDSCDSSDNSDQPKDSAPKPYKSHIPDMSKYIKKDSIPCWGCSLDY